MKQIAINGFGRIGRNILRALLESPRDDYSIVAVNDLAPVETAALLLSWIRPMAGSTGRSASVTALSKSTGGASPS